MTLLNFIGKFVISFVTLASGFFCFGLIAQGAVLHFTPFEILTPIDSEVLVSVLLKSDNERINAIEGIINIPPNLQVKEIITGSSIIDLWVEQPQIMQDGIRFAGIIPGGFEGTQSVDAYDLNGKLFSFVVKAISRGSGALTITDYNVLLHDGRATPTFVDTIVLPVTITDASALTDRFIIVDNEPPYPFEIIFMQDTFVYEGAPVLVFSTTDADSGVGYYEVSEQKWRFLNYFRRTYEVWERAESPYLIKDTTLKSEIKIRAIDKVGNITTQIFSPQPLMRIRFIERITVILLAIFAVLFLLKIIFKYAKKII